MTDLDTRINALVGELVESAPEPPPFPGDHIARPPSDWRRGLLVAVGALVVVVLVGSIGALVGRAIFPESAVETDPTSLDFEVVRGEPGPEPRFSPESLGEAQLLRLPSGRIDLREMVPLGIVSPATAVGRIGPTGHEVFTWRTRTDGLEGWCLAVTHESGGGMQWCSSGRPGTPQPDVQAPRGLTVRVDEQVLGAVVLWQTPPDTSVVVVEGIDAYWQLSVGGVAAFWIPNGLVELRVGGTRRRRGPHRVHCLRLHSDHP